MINIKVRTIDRSYPERVSPATQKVYIITLHSSSYGKYIGFAIGTKANYSAALHTPFLEGDHDP